MKPSSNKDNILKRECKKCHKEMFSTAKDTQPEHPLPSRDKQLLYKCNNCKHEVLIANKTTILTNLLSGISIFAALSYFLFSGLFEFILYCFSASFLAMLGGLSLIAISLFFFIGAILNIQSALKQFTTKSQYPDISSNEQHCESKKSFYMALSLGACPVLFSLILGMIDFYFHQLNETIAMLAIPIVFSPIIFARKLRSSPIEVFYGLLFWAFSGLIAYFILR